MVIQGMGSRGGGEAKANALATQGSLYSLTLDEVRNQLGNCGKPLNSMNLDEFVKTVWTIESNQEVVGGNDYGPVQQGASQHHPSSITMSRDLSKKTVDEVWQDIQQGVKIDNVDKRSQERQLTLGEITLEDFLVKAGVIAESTQGKRISGLVFGVDSMSLTQQAQWPHYQIPAMQQVPEQQHQQQQQNIPPVFMPGHPIQQPLPVVANPIMDATYPETQVTMSPAHIIGTLSDTQTSGRKRVAPRDVAENSVERRQKRMIKNRESAARSRARKQAYTHELENKVSFLEEENERLKRQKEIEDILPTVPPPEPKYQLRRTSSGPI
ncbi:ABSCISIC ACID-INSENSITIVE 5-like protein 2 [Solanum pennellii]|uniref:ABSCISIC ACID-INSENSITIVE 5-like protein 2 n=1 Tax=Solanum pennellii TaxID=28526 RepID=A0ABM1HQW6_SOLPN|nr:ABSCISIC ACID-INSENSITIVE 5-like protein 2 [Solanum pennellii]XP_015089046.1 ABSCISIC ACID-INSENSITIVE 5-like protein 2 [Solanum pennellii]XP_015089047.1 ABSCISIC ACID-INSENSITIVE 5-like protein 2 [Solanum pennellii]XP_015089048.1 ABSCISIC ACID-INSENSITIVE 5-like protein 2 [Solanum pennellii]